MPTGPRRCAITFSYARENDLFLTYAIINPHADRAKTAGNQPDAFIATRLCGQDCPGDHGEGREDAGHQRHHGQ